MYKAKYYVRKGDEVVLEGYFREGSMVAIEIQFYRDWLLYPHEQGHLHLYNALIQRVSEHGHTIGVDRWVQSKDLPGMGYWENLRYLMGVDEHHCVRAKPVPVTGKVAYRAPREQLQLLQPSQPDDPGESSSKGKAKETQASDSNEAKDETRSKGKGKVKDTEAGGSDTLSFRLKANESQAGSSGTSKSKGEGKEKGKAKKI